MTEEAKKTKEAKAEQEEPPPTPPFVTPFPLEPTAKVEGEARVEEARKAEGASTATAPSKAQEPSEEEGAEESSEEDYDWVDDVYLEEKCEVLAQCLGTQVGCYEDCNMPMTAVALLEAAWQQEAEAGEDDDRPERWERLQVMADVAGYEPDTGAATALDAARDIIEFARELLGRLAEERGG